jgi:hypothetical protein
MTEKTKAEREQIRHEGRKRKRQEGGLKPPLRDRTPIWRFNPQNSRVGAEVATLTALLMGGVVGMGLGG